MDTEENKDQICFVSGLMLDHKLTALRFRMQSSLHLLPSTTGRFRKISGLSLTEGGGTGGSREEGGGGGERGGDRDRGRRGERDTESEQNFTVQDRG